MDQVFYLPSAIADSLRNTVDVNVPVFNN